MENGRNTVNEIVPARRLTGAAGLLVLLMFAAIGARLLLGYEHSDWRRSAIYASFGVIAAILVLPFLVLVNAVGLVWVARAIIGLIITAAAVTLVFAADWTELDKWRWAVCVALIVVTAVVIAVKIGVRRSPASNLEKSMCPTIPTFRRRFRRKLLWAAIVLVAAGVLIWTVWGVFGPISAAISVAVPVVSFIGVTLLARSLLSGVGDAARYLSNEPDNVAEREKIRAGLIEILRTLHTATDPTTNRPTFDRIILVGHSLGSVIAYDALHTYFTEVASTIPVPNVGDQCETATVLENLESLLKPLPAIDKADVEGLNKILTQKGHKSPHTSWVAAQRKLQRLLRDRQQLSIDRPKVPSITGRWIVSDFVTVGSPLAHAEMLLADNPADLLRRRRRRLLPSNPPATQVTQRPPAGARTIRHWVPGPKVPDASRLHHASVFAPTTWTNLYFRHDLVGGPVAHSFGNGVQDKDLGTASPRLFDFLSAYPHSSYWPKRGTPHQEGMTESCQILRDLIFPTNNVLYLSGTRSTLEKVRSVLAEHHATVGCLDMIDGLCVEVRMLVSAPGAPARPWMWAGPDSIWPSGYAPRLIAKILSDVNPPPRITLTIPNS